MKSGKFISTKINEYLNGDNLKDILIRRIPFLSEYKIYNHPRDGSRLEAIRISNNSDVDVVWGDEVITFPQYNVSSEIIYYKHTVDDNTFHNFIIKNKFWTSQPKSMDDLTFRVFLMAMNILEKNLSYSEEIMVSGGEYIKSVDLDRVINDMNGVLFKIEEFTEKNSINLF